MSVISLRPDPRRGPNHYLKAAREFGAEGFTTAELFACTKGVAPSTVSSWVAESAKAGGLVVIAKRRGASVYAVAGLDHARSAREATEARTRRHLWTAMRSLSTFSLAELVATASTDDLVIGRRAAADYVRRLAIVGVLIPLRPQTKRSVTHYRLRPSADTGPLAPREINAKVLIDRNTGKPLGGAEARP
jgi:hypothetical protein